MPPDLIIRPVAERDAHHWRRLWCDYLAFYHTTVAEEVYETSFKRLLDPNWPDLNGLIAETNGTPTGLVHYIFHRHMWRQDDVCYLQDLFVDPSARGTGMGRALIEAVYDKADAAGAPTVYWMTQTHNSTARQLYDRIADLTDFIKYQRSPQ
ncbi:MAG: GNAT family N-acetyltransferase [Pseudomonadota bacterium]